MSDSHSIETIKKHRNVYIGVFLALLVGTAITVGMYYVHFDSMAVTVAVALFIATFKASLVAAFFMHLSNERKAIYSTLLVTVFFFAAMMWFIVYSRGDVPLNTEYPASKYMPYTRDGGK